MDILDYRSKIFLKYVWSKRKLKRIKLKSDVHLSLLSRNPMFTWSKEWRTKGLIESFNHEHSSSKRQIV